jgi:hypothetical protein
MLEYKGHRFRYDNDGNVLGPSLGYIAQQQESGREMARTSSGEGGAIPAFGLALLALGWAVQQPHYLSSARSFSLCASGPMQAA